MSRKASGLRAWALQRATAVYLGLFFIYLVGALAVAPPADAAAWQAWMSHPVMSIASLVFVLALLVHAWVGVRDIIIDYLWHTGVRMAALALVALVLAGSGLWALQTLVLARLA